MSWPALTDMLGGLPVLGPVHTFLAWAFAAFIVMHVYLTTASGRRPMSAIRSMVIGYEHVERRKYQRYEDELKVVLGTDRKRTEELTRNISRGGMLIETTRELAPPLMRWGGCFSSYYRWREGVGPREARVPMHNLLWGGMESNQVGTAEFVDICRQVGADPLLAVNFESDGRQRWAHRRPVL